MIAATDASLGPLVIVTASQPWGGQIECFVVPELRQLASNDRIVVVPVWPRSPKPDASLADLEAIAVARHPFGLGVLAASMAELLRRPRRVARAVGLAWDGRLRTSARGLAAVPKALWLARSVRRWRAAHIHAYWASVPATVVMMAAAVTDVPWSMTAHRGDVSPPGLLPRKVARSSWVRCISQATVQMISDVAPGTLEDRHPVVIHLGVDVGGAVVRGFAAEGPLRIVCAARLLPRKRHQDLLSALRLVLDRGVDAQLTLAGSGPEEPRLRELVDRLDLAERVDLRGHVENDELLDWYRAGAVDLVVLTSDSEGIPVSLMEAMAAEVPVIAADVGGVRELLNGGAGLMVEAGDVAAMADAIQSLAEDPDARRRLGRAGRVRVEQEFDARVTAAALLRRLRGG